MTALLLILLKAETRTVSATNRPTACLNFKCLYESQSFAKTAFALHARLDAVMSRSSNTGRLSLMKGVGSRHPFEGRPQKSRYPQLKSVRRMVLEALSSQKGSDHGTFHYDDGRLYWSTLGTSAGCLPMAPITGHDQQISETTKHCLELASKGPGAQ